MITANFEKVEGASVKYTMLAGYIKNNKSCSLDTW